MKAFILIITCSLFITSQSYGEGEAKGHIIPKDSKVEHDYRVSPNPFMMDSISAKKLADCETYEELRDQLKILIPELLKASY